jgi:hypothetical protein
LLEAFFFEVRARRTGGGEISSGVTGAVVEDLFISRFRLTHARL